MKEATELAARLRAAGRESEAARMDQIAASDNPDLELDNLARKALEAAQGIQHGGSMTPRGQEPSASLASKSEASQSPGSNARYEMSLSPRVRGGGGGERVRAGLSVSQYQEAMEARVAAGLPEVTAAIEGGVEQGGGRDHVGLIVEVESALEEHLTSDSIHGSSMEPASILARIPGRPMRASPALTASIQEKKKVQRDGSRARGVSPSRRGESPARGGVPKTGVAPTAKRELRDLSKRGSKEVNQGHVFDRLHPKAVGTSDWAQNMSSANGGMAEGSPGRCVGEEQVDAPSKETKKKTLSAAESRALTSRLFESPIRQQRTERRRAREASPARRKEEERGPGIVNDSKKLSASSQGTPREGGRADAPAGMSASVKKQAASKSNTSAASVADKRTPGVEKRKGRVSRQDAEAMVSRLYNVGAKQDRTERMMALRGQALAKELNELKPVPVISENSKAMTKDLEPFFQRLPHMEEERKERLEYKRRQYQAEKNSKSTFTPEISMVAHKMDRNVNSLLNWGKEKEERQRQARQKHENEQNHKQPFQPKISRKSREIAARMPKSTIDGTRATARAQAAEEATETESDSVYEGSMASSRASRRVDGEDSVYERLYSGSKRVSSHGPSDPQGLLGGQHEEEATGKTMVRSSSRSRGGRTSLNSSRRGSLNSSQLESSRGRPPKTSKEEGSWMVGPARGIPREMTGPDYDYAELEGPVSAMEVGAPNSSDYDVQYQNIYKELWDDFAPGDHHDANFDHDRDAELI